MAGKSILLHLELTPINSVRNDNLVITVQPRICDFLGKVVSGFRVRDRSKWDLIGKRDPQQPQMFYPIKDDKMVINKGDILAARCTMVNKNDWPVFAGPTNDDEMCNFYIMYWVKGGSPISPATCFTPGPPKWSWGGWENGAGLKNIPDEQASTL